MRSYLSLATAIAAAAYPIVQTAQAQSLEEITVTARRTEESLQEVPISISAFTGDQLQDMGVVDNEQVAYMTVNFNSVQQLGRRLDRPVIRGMSAPSTFGEPNASYFIDGAYVSGSISNLTMGPIERVEILRGPQSAQFGRATFSGAVSYVTRRPTNDFMGEVTLSGASQETDRINGWVSGPIIPDQLLFFVSGGYNQYGGEWNNSLEANSPVPAAFIDPPQQADSSNLGGTQTAQFDTKLLWIATDSTDLTFKFGYTHGDDDHYPQLIVEPSELNCYVPGLDLQPGDPGYDTSPGSYCGVLETNGRVSRLNIPDLYTGISSTFANFPPSGTVPSDWVSQGEKPGMQRDFYTGLIRLDQELGDWTLTAQGAYNNNAFDTAYDLDGTEFRPFQGLFSMFNEDSREDASFDIRLATPADLPVRASIGSYYLQVEQENRQHSNVGLAQGSISDPTTRTTENAAVFGSFEWDMTRLLRFATEARYAKDTKKNESPIMCLDPSSPYYDPFNTITHEESTSAFTPRVTLSYFPSDTSMVYMQYARGNKPGDWNNGYYTDGVNGCGTQEAYNGDGHAWVEEEDSWNYEVGGKTSWWNNRLVANLALFFIDWENQTVFETRNINRDFLFAPQAIGINAGKSEVYGMELETSFALTDNLTGTFGYGFNYGQFIEYESGSLEELTGDGNAAGNQIPNSPKHNFVTSLAYAKQINQDYEWFARTDFSFESRKYTSATNTEQIGERRRWNARLGLDSGLWRGSLFVNNILDETTPSAIIGFPRLLERNASNINPQAYALTPTPGRLVGAEIIVRFGN